MRISIQQQSKTLRSQLIICEKKSGRISYPATMKDTSESEANQMMNTRKTNNDEPGKQIMMKPTYNSGTK
ncbi:29216_t:CDS:2 [Gigaspora margarita]|uniref:29216_t:CDS:1 n=1 Tax=Gigaspora margarita TaxID=4874 RepID=A0ABN7UVQ2_GIGMA|nr:29216_t:CDS:2 [Gigaspora margarita]